MSTTEAPFSFTTKVRGDLLTVRGETVDEFASRLMELASNAMAVDALTELQSLGGQAAAVTTVKEAVGGTVVSQSSSSGPREVHDQWGGVWTYGLAEAPALPDGRGQYAKKNWTDKSGKARVAWVDPSKGPESFPKGQTEAPIKFING